MTQNHHITPPNRPNRLQAEQHIFCPKQQRVRWERVPRPHRGGDPTGLNYYRKWLAGAFHPAWQSKHPSLAYYTHSKAGKSAGREQSWAGTRAMRTGNSQASRHLPGLQRPSRYSTALSLSTFLAAPTTPKLSPKDRSGIPRGSPLSLRVVQNGTKANQGE